MRIALILLSLLMVAIVALSAGCMPSGVQEMKNVCEGVSANG